MSELSIIYNKLCEKVLYMDEINKDLRKQLAEEKEAHNKTRDACQQYEDAVKWCEKQLVAAQTELKLEYKTIEHIRDGKFI